MATCTYSVPDKNVSGDNLYGPRICSQPRSSTGPWAAHGFQQDYWDEGFGYEAACDTNKALARTFNAIWLLNYSAEDYWNEDWGNNILHWGRRYVRDQIDDLRARCGDGSAIATAFGAPSWTTASSCTSGSSTPTGVVLRAGTLIHEARHMGGKSHNAKFPAGSVYGAGKDGADSNWGYGGAWMYNALYLWWFYADGRRTTWAIAANGPAARQRDHRQRLRHASRLHHQLAGERPVRTGAPAASVSRSHGSGRRPGSFGSSRQ